MTDFGLAVAKTQQAAGNEPQAIQRPRGGYFVVKSGIGTVVAIWYLNWSCAIAICDLKFVVCYLQSEI
jgi:hypothetical protein